MESTNPRVAAIGEPRQVARFCVKVPVIANRWFTFDAAALDGARTSLCTPGHHEAPGMDVAARTGWVGLRRLNDIVDLVFEIACSVLLTVMVMTIFVQVLARYVFLASTPWSEEVAVYCFIWVVLLGTSLGVRSHGHLVADVLPDDLPAAVEKAFVALSLSLVTIVALVFLWYGAEYARLGITRLSFSMGFPMVYIYAGMPIAGAAMLLFLAERFHHLFASGSER